MCLNFVIRNQEFLKCLNLRISFLIGSTKSELLIMPAVFEQDWNYKLIFQLTKWNSNKNVHYTYLRIMHISNYFNFIETYTGLKSLDKQLMLYQLSFAWCFLRLLKWRLKNKLEFKTINIWQRIHSVTKILSTILFEYLMQEF